MPQTAVLYVSHLVTLGTLWNYFRIRRAVRDECDLYWVCHGPSARRRLSRLPIQTFAVTDEILESWKPAMNGNGIVPGNCHILTIAFSQRHRYDQYWLVEYDIRYTGEWCDVFDLSRSSDADLIAAFVESPFLDASWSHWDSINLPYSELARSFNPICRMSHRLLECVTDLITSGYWAHNEALLASVCRNHGWFMHDLNELARNQWGEFIYTPGSSANAQGTLNYRPVTSRVWNGEPNKLHHPVKPWKWFLEKFGVVHGLIRALRSRF